jgi:hypothetical protein
MKPHPHLALTILARAGIDPATVRRGHRRAVVAIPANMARAYATGEARAWRHSPLAGALWEAGTRAARAIALADDCAKKCLTTRPTPTNLPPAAPLPPGPGRSGNPHQTEKMSTIAHLPTIEIKETPKGFQVLKNGLPYSTPQTYFAQAQTIAENLATDARNKAARKAFWENQDATARSRGMKFRSGHAGGGNAYHRTQEAAEKAAQKAARAACPSNPPAWHVVPI